MNRPLRPAGAERVPDIVLSVDELRAVTAFNLACALRVIDLFESARPDDSRPREALVAAEHFVNGDDRSKAMRVSALAAHRAAKVVDPPAAHAAMAAGDTAASAYLHPLADALQVGHILRGPSHSVLALVLRPVDPLPRRNAEAIVVREATPTVVEVLRRYPRVDMRSPAVADVMIALDARLRDPTLR